MAIRFITLTTRSGKIRINEEHITSLQDIGDGMPGAPQTNMLAGGQTLFLLESEREIIDICANGKTHEPRPAQATPPGADEPTGQSAKRKAGRPRKRGLSAAEKRNIEAAERLEALARARDAERTGAKGQGGEGGGSGAD